ncbi:hypothetical protein ABFA25_03920 [Mycobacterium lepromatosis]|nr:hypothetical protein [Mycobacterium lepromatosis]
MNSWEMTTYSTRSDGLGRHSNIDPASAIAALLGITLNAAT